MSLTSDDARVLADGFYEVADGIKEYRRETSLEPDEKNELKDLESEIRNKAGDFTVMAVNLDLAEAQTSVIELGKITGAARAAITSIQTIGKVIDLSTKVLKLAVAIVSKNPGGVAEAAGELKTIIFDEFLQQATLRRAAPVKAAAPSPEETKKAAESEAPVTKAEVEKEVLLATRDLAVVKAQVELLSKIFPKGEVKPLEGKVEADKVENFGQLVAYKALNQIAKQIAAKLKEKLPAENAAVMIVPQLDFALGDIPWVEITRQIDDLEAMLKAQKEENAGLLRQPEKPGVVRTAAVAPTVVLGVVSMAAELLGYFKTDYISKGYEVKLDEEALRLSVIKELLDKQKVYLPNFYSLHAKNLKIITRFNGLKKELIGLLSAKQTLAARMQESTDETEKKNLQKAQEACGALETAIKTFAADVNAKPAEQECKLVQAALREWMYDELKITHLLYLKVLPGGGQAITKKSRWPWRTSNILYLGGSAVSYVLTKLDGTIVATDSLRQIEVYDCDLSSPKVGPF